MIRTRTRFLHSTVVPSPAGKRRHYHELSFAQHGDPLQVLLYHPSDNKNNWNKTNSNSNETITVEMKYAAWNPADINQVQGKYPSLASPFLRQSSFTQRTVAGAEGIGIVTNAPEHANDKNIKRGDIVITVGGIGTLRSHVSLPLECVLPVFTQHSQQEHDIALCPHDAIFFQLAGTAYNLLQQSQHGKETEGAIVQNAGNSAVATILAQMAPTPVVSLVRQRSCPQEMDFLHDYLVSTCGVAQVCMQEDYMQDRAKLRALRDEWNFQLAFNAVGGESSQLLLQLLQPVGHHVTYGGMSQQPVTVRTSDLIFRHLQLSGYWHSQWMWQQSYASRIEFVQRLVRDYYDGDASGSSSKIQLPPVQVFALRDWAEALRWEKEQTGPIRSKVVFDLSLE